MPKQVIVAGKALLDVRASAHPGGGHSASQNFTAAAAGTHDRRPFSADTRRDDAVFSLSLPGAGGALGHLGHDKTDRLLHTSQIASLAPHAARPLAGIGADFEWEVLTHGGGLPVKSISGGCGAQQAGVEAGDVIVSVDGISLETAGLSRELVERLLSGPPHSHAYLDVLKGSSHSGIIRDLACERTDLPLARRAPAASHTPGTSQIGAHHASPSPRGHPPMKAALNQETSGVGDGLRGEVDALLSALSLYYLRHSPSEIGRAQVPFHCVCNGCRTACNGCRAACNGCRAVCNGCRTACNGCRAVRPLPCRVPVRKFIHRHRA